MIVEGRFVKETEAVGGAGVGAAGIRLAGVGVVAIDEAGGAYARKVVRITGLTCGKGRARTEGALGGITAVIAVVEVNISPRTGTRIIGGIAGKAFTASTTGARMRGARSLIAGVG